ncbi:hypothetical protein I5M27_00620 [Adhaeribacter sp. BT258]|uniref:Mannosyltransferase (PIG-V) n=1 Tax=Adhaeribacter terrigena TaxID=2793070 RepID=A0ABS1BYJ5_9BACT|nr:hypothetical protein [Adhaeribacter terrigena]MBK0401463.1 hypothetical protein [Adhaeribacter terrigena]
MILLQRRAQVLPDKKYLNLLLCLGHLFFLIFVFAGLRLLQAKVVFPAETELLNWDAEHYHAISKKGYFGINVAFFPLLPAIWRLTGFSGYGIALLNAGVFYAAFLCLAGMLQLRKREILLILSVPGFLFFYVPYTEALFFAGAVLFLYALKKEHFWFLILSIFLVSFIRPVISILLPALVLTVFIRHKPGDEFYALKTIIWGFISVLPGLIGLAYLQKTQTGSYFGFITIQAEHWHHYLQMPSFPLSTWENSTRLVLLLDGIGLFIALLCGVKVMQQMWFKYKKPENLLEGYVLFSHFYLAGCGAAILLFQGGGLINMNRYLFATAFFVVVFKHFANHYKFKPAHFFYLFGSLEVFWLLFKSYDRLNTFLRLSLASVYYSAILAVFHRSAFVRNTAFAIFYVTNAVAQMYCLDVFMSGQWIS